MLIKKFAEPAAEQPPKSWLSQKLSELDLWWYVWQPHWCRTAGRFYWSHIRPIFAPQNRWAVKPVRRTWQDKPELIREWLYASIIDFVEREKCFEVTDWEYTENTRRLAAELREVYEWAKTGRAAFYAKAEALPISIDSGEEIWDEYNRLTTELEQWDDRCLTWIVQNRAILWC